MTHTQTHHMPSLDHFRSSLLLATALVTGLAIASPAFAASDSGAPAWTPQASERLVKLPATYLKKSIDLDFADSQLGQAIQGADKEIALKGQTLGDLQSAIERADGKVRTELRHQFLAEKRKFLEIMSHRNELRSKYLKTRQRLLENMLNRLGGNGADASPARRELINRQEAAKSRFEASLTKVDMSLFNSAAVPQSKYTHKYTENMAAIEKLVSRIQNHKMNASVQVDGQALTKPEYVRQMLADAQAKISILDQEETVLGYMAKLVALDALALSEDTMDAELADSDLPASSGPASVVSFFMSN